jgi:hypothetical protein
MIPAAKRCREESESYSTIVNGSIVNASLARLGQDGEAS